MKNVQTDIFYNAKSFIGLSLVKWHQETLELTMLSLKIVEKQKIVIFSKKSKISIFPEKFQIP